MIELVHDCFDISGGVYEISNGQFSNCNDKGLSVGEKSNLILDNIEILNSNIGIAVKDLSILKSKNTRIINTPICAQINQKSKNLVGICKFHTN